VQGSRRPVEWLRRWQLSPSTRMPPSKLSFQSARSASQASPYRRLRDHAEFVATDGSGMSEDKLALPVATRFTLVRIALTAGHGGISADGDLIWFKEIRTKRGKRLVKAKPGEAGAFLLGVARSLDRVLKSEDILVRNWEPRGNPTNDSHITHRNATILVSQAIHLGDWFFRAQPLGIQPEFEESAGRLDEAKSQVALGGRSE
jgi:hypothetical protein